jgi:hypothetical protein
MTDAPDNVVKLAEVLDGERARGGRGGPGGERGKSQATRLVELAADAELFHDPDQQPYATIPVDGHRDTWPLKAKGFEGWLAYRYYAAEGAVAGAKAIADALAALKGRALFEGPEHAVHVRIAEHDGAVLLDLANAAWEAIEITASGWRVVTAAPVKFRRPRGMLALPTPVPRADLAEARAFLNVDDGAWVLIAAWLVAAARPRGPYPPLALGGEHGAGKSVACDVLRRIIDPSTAELRAEPRDVRDLMIAAANAWVLAFDNLSGIRPWLSDALCRIATGGGFGTRELYTNDEETLIEAQRPIALNGIGEVIARPDLLDRAIIVRLNPIPDERRVAEEPFWAAFEAAHPRILGALLDAVVVGLGRLDKVNLDRHPRMADFARWATACAPALGWDDETFLAAYEEMRDDAHLLALEDSLIVDPIIKLARGGGFVGNAKQLLNRLEGLADDGATLSKRWPGSPEAMRHALARVAPNLRAVGIEIEFPKRGDKTRAVTITATGRDE